VLPAHNYSKIKYPTKYSSATVCLIHLLELKLNMRGILCNSSAITFYGNMYFSGLCGIKIYRFCTFWIIQVMKMKQHLLLIRILPTGYGERRGFYSTSSTSPYSCQCRSSPPHGVRTFLFILKSLPPTCHSSSRCCVFELMNKCNLFGGSIKQVVDTSGTRSYFFPLPFSEGNK